MEGELRLVNQSAVDNWVQGRLEVFFEGTWSQVCGFAFDAADAEVACRQLGFLAGTSLSTFAAEAPAQDVLVFPRAAITKSGCNGSEARLVDCPVDTTLNSFVERRGGCYGSGPGQGLYLACVADPVAGDHIMMPFFPVFSAAVHIYLHNNPLCIFPRTLDITLS